MIDLKKVLKKRSRTVSFLVRKTGISRYSLDQIVKGKKYPTIKQAELIAKALDIGIEYFFNKNTITINGNS